MEMQLLSSLESFSLDCVCVGGRRVEEMLPCYNTPGTFPVSRETNRSLVIYWENSQPTKTHGGSTRGKLLSLNHLWEMSS